MNNFTLKQKIIFLLLCPFVSLLLTQAVYDMPIKIGIIVMIACEIFLAVSFFIETRSKKKHDKLQNAIENGEYGTDEEWRVKYAEFVENKGFEPVKYSSMKKDLYRRYLRPTAFIMFAIAVTVLVVGIISMDVVDLMIFCGVVGSGFAAYGVYCLSSPNVRRFLKCCGESYQIIENSYVNGKQLTYRKNLTESACNDGINIGSEYIVIFRQKEIAALRISDVIGSTHRISHVNHSVNSVYMFSEYLHFIDVTVRNPMSGAARTFTAQLSEFQAELACETIDRLTHDTNARL